MEALDKMTSQANKSSSSSKGMALMPEDKTAMGHMKYAQGMGASLRYANELRAVQQVSRLSSLKSSHLHEDVLRGRLGAGVGYANVWSEQR